MKKKNIIILIFALFICINFHLYGTSALTNKPVKQSKEEQYKDIFCSLLLPHVQKLVGDYYAQFLTDIPTVDPWDINVLSVERPNNSFVFVIKMQVIPYVGPHLDVGVDQITITVGGAGEVKVNKFEHIKSNYLDLPPNYQHIIKKNLR